MSKGTHAGNHSHYPRPERAAHEPAEMAEAPARVSGERGSLPALLPPPEEEGGLDDNPRLE